MFYFIQIFAAVVHSSSKSYPEVQLVGPGADHPVLGHGPVVDLVLEDVIASRGVSVLVEDHGCTGTPCCQERIYSRAQRGKEKA